MVIEGAEGRVTKKELSGVTETEGVWIVFIALFASLPPFSRQTSPDSIDTVTHGWFSTYKLKHHFCRMSNKK